MIVPGSVNPLLLKSAAAAGGLQVSRSLRFNASDSAYLSKVFAVAGNRKTWTWSAWVKRSKVDSQQMFFRGGTTLTDTGIFNFQFLSTGQIRCDSETEEYLRTTQVFRDPSAWYHIVIAFDVTQGTNANKLKLYVNGSEITAYSIDVRSLLSNQNYGVNQAQGHVIGGEPITSNRYFDGYLTNIHFIDGQALTPASFAETDATTGQWIPKAFSGGSYGTNGFYLKFDDNSSNTASTLGKDYSGLGNNWTPNNFSVTAGAGNDSLVDSPTNYGTDTGVGGEVRGNYATWNPLNAQLGAGSVSNGNLDFTGPSGSANYNFIGGTFAIDTSSTTGWYFEITQTTYGNGSMVSLLDTGFQASALSNQSAIGYSGTNSTAGISYANGGEIHNYGSTTTGLTSWTSSGDIISIAIKNNKIWFAKNGTWISGSPSAGTSPSITLGSTKYVTPAAGGINSSVFSLNGGQRAFAYTAPSGFRALCTQNLPAPLVTKPNTVFDVVKYDGNGSTQNITGLAFSPDLVWVKARSYAYPTFAFDAIRGATNYLMTSSTGAEDTIANSLTSFNSDGFSLGASAYVNYTSNTFVGWCWDAGTSTVSNTQGSITSQVRANATAGFSVVTYTGDLSGSGTSTVGHGLGVAPKMIIFKRRDGTSDWPVQHSGLPSANNLLYLNSTAATSTSGYGTIVAPTSTVFTVAWLTGMGVSGQTHVAYCFSPVVGYSNFGSYTGNGSTGADGPFVYTGFRPKWIMIKCSSSSQGGNASWRIFDAVRNPYNIVAEQLQADFSDAAASGSNEFDFTSNGVKIRYNSSGYNASGATYIYAAFAESPLNYARAR